MTCQNRGLWLAVSEGFPHTGYFIPGRDGTRAWQISGIAHASRAREERTQEERTSCEDAGREDKGREDTGREDTRREDTRRDDTRRGNTGGKIPIRPAKAG